VPKKIKKIKNGLTPLYTNILPWTFYTQSVNVLFCIWICFPLEIPFTISDLEFQTKLFFQEKKVSKNFKHFLIVFEECNLDMTMLLALWKTMIDLYKVQIFLKIIREK
jgi:hypothetical protein